MTEITQRAMQKVFLKSQEYAGLEEYLDELVEDVLAAQASQVNNGGVKSQIKFLLESGFRAEDLIKNFEKHLR